MAVTKITKENYKQEVLDSPNLVLIDFWASWCGPCKMLGPVIDELSNEVPSNIKVCKVNVDEEPELASHFNVLSIPTVYVVQDKKIVNHFVGYRPKQAIKEFIGLK